MTNPPQYPQYPSASPQFTPPSPPQIQQRFLAPAGPDLGLASVRARLGARVLDLVFWYVGYFVTAIPVMIWIDEGGGAAARTVLFVWLAATFSLYFPFSLWKFGSTLGKRICGVRIVRAETAERVGFWRAVGRETFWLVANIVPVLSLLNPLRCCWDKPYRQCLHDKVANTMAVVRGTT